MKAVLALLALLVLGPAAAAGDMVATGSDPLVVAAGQCLGISARYCDAGRSGEGGCYDPARAQCDDGAVCSLGLNVCRKGSKGRGGCYRAAEFRCDQGAIVRKSATQQTMQQR
jgi:hypothetical protein